MWFWYGVAFKRKASQKVWRRYYWTFFRQRKLLAGSEDVVKASVYPEENSSWNRKIFIFKRKKRWSTRNFVFNKSTQETRRTWLSWLILHLKETPRRINPKNWLQNELWLKIPKKGILTLTKVKTDRRWLTALFRASQSIYFFITFFCYNIVAWMYVIFVTLFNVFDKHREKYAKPDFVKYISLEIKICSHKVI